MSGLQLWYQNIFLETIYTSNLFNMDTKGTEPSVRFTEVSILQRLGMYDFRHF